MARTSGARCAIWDNHSTLAAADGTSHKPLGSLPLFLRHDPGAKKGDNQFKPVTTETGRNIVEGRVKEALGVSAAGTITPTHSGTISSPSSCAPQEISKWPRRWPGIAISARPACMLI